MACGHSCWSRQCSGLGSNPAPPTHCPSPGKSHNRGDSTAPHGKTRNSPSFNSPLSPCIVGSASAGPSWNPLGSLGRSSPGAAAPAPCWVQRAGPGLPRQRKAVALLALDSPAMLRSRSWLCGPGRSLPPSRGVHVLGSVCFCLQLCLIGNSTL